MPQQYKPISLDMQEEYLKRFALCPQKASDYSFANLWGWAEEYGLEYLFGNQCVWIRQTIPETVYWAPVGPWHDVDWDACPIICNTDRYIRVPSQLAEIWKNKLAERCKLVESRGHWDYLYSVAELTELRGNRFHKKKNHLNQFKKQYDWEYRPMDADCVEEALELQDEWCQWRECEDSPALIAENQAVLRTLTNWDRIPGLLGGSLYVDGHMVAYTVAEPLTKDTVVIHFEKGKPGFRGVYQGMNQMFLQDQGQRFVLVNREQDLDDEGLRKAKLSYHPTGFLEKYEVHVA